MLLILRHYGWRRRQRIVVVGFSRHDNDRGCLALGNRHGIFIVTTTKSLECMRHTHLPMTLLDFARHLGGLLGRRRCVGGSVVSVLRRCGGRCCSFPFVITTTRHLHNILVEQGASFLRFQAQRDGLFLFVHPMHPLRPMLVVYAQVRQAGLKRGQARLCHRLGQEKLVLVRVIDGRVDQTGMACRVQNGPNVVQGLVDYQSW